MLELPVPSGTIAGSPFRLNQVVVHQSCLSASTSRQSSSHTELFDPPVPPSFLLINHPQLCFLHPAVDQPLSVKVTLRANCKAAKSSEYNRRSTSSRTQALLCLNHPSILAPLRVHHVYSTKLSLTSVVQWSSASARGLINDSSIIEVLHPSFIPIILDLASSVLLSNNY